MRCASNDRSMGGVSMFGVAKMVFFKVLINCPVMFVVELKVIYL